MKNDNEKLKKSGYIALTTVLILTAVMLIIVLSLNLNAISESKIAISEEATHKAFFLATACAEDALRKLKDNTSYGGNETIAIGSESCFIETVEGSGNANRIVKTRSTVGEHTRKVRVEIATVNPDTAITSWQEVADY